MGMDISGRNPISEVGEYVRFSIWGWRPMAEYLEKTAPGLTSKVEYLHSNDGDGLDGPDSVTLAEILEAELANGNAQHYVEARDAHLAALPLEECRWCSGTGVRTDEVGVKMRMPERNWCNGCDGKGKVKTWECSYGMEVEDVRRFAAFLRDCGGFSIW